MTLILYDGCRYVLLKRTNGYKEILYVYVTAYTLIRAKLLCLFLNAVIPYLSLAHDCSGDDVPWTVRHVRRHGYPPLLHVHHERQARYSSHCRLICLCWR